MSDNDEHTEDLEEAGPVPEAGATSIAQPPEAPVEEQERGRPALTRPIIGGIALVALLALAAAIVAVRGGDDGSEDTSSHMSPAARVAVAYTEAINKQDYPAACPLETEDMRSGKSVEECAAESRGPATRTPGPVAVVREQQLTRGTAVLVQFFYPDKPSDPEQTALRVVQEGGHWLVDQDDTVFDNEKDDPDYLRKVLEDGE